MKTIAKTLACVLGAWVLILVAPGASTYVREHAAPFFGGFFLVATAGFLVYTIYELFSSPIHRSLRSVGDRIELSWRGRRVRREIERRALSSLEEQRVRMLSLSARVHEQAATALSDGKLRHELDTLKANSERVLLRAQSHEIERYILRYQIALTQLSSSPNMSAGEKLRALRQIRALIEEDQPQVLVPAPHWPDPTELTLWEYRSQGSVSVQVTAEGLRRLLERGLLEDTDEFRRFGDPHWTAVLSTEASDTKRGESPGALSSPTSARSHSAWNHPAR